MSSYRHEDIFTIIRNLMIYFHLRFASFLQIFSFYGLWQWRTLKEGNLNFKSYVSRGLSLLSLTLILSFLMAIKATSLTRVLASKSISFLFCCRLSYFLVFMFSFSFCLIQIEILNRKWKLWILNDVISAFLSLFKMYIFFGLCDKVDDFLAQTSIIYDVASSFDFVCNPFSNDSMVKCQKFVILWSNKFQHWFLDSLNFL